MFRKVVRAFQSNVKEWIDSPAELQSKISALASLIKKAKYPIFFTGAGCSTSLGIPDYRSGHNTIIKTGPGVWNRKKQSGPSLKIEKLVDKAAPSFTHMAIRTLLRKNIFKFLVSQNTDGLHLRSGVGFNQIAELHGNRNLEKCPSCESHYLRDFRTIRPNKKTEQEKLDHRTGRKCQNCQNQLYDSIVYFGEKLSKQELVKAFKNAAKCDLCLCLGSSLTVKPSVNVPILAKQSGAQLCIINIQQTPLDQLSLKINEFCDTSMKILMEKLEIQVDQYTIQHYFELNLEQKNLQVKGKDEREKNFMFIKEIQYNGGLFTSDECFIEIPMEEETNIFIRLHGEKPLLQLDLRNYYKIFHGEKVQLKAKIAQHEKQWQISQI